MFTVKNIINKAFDRTGIHPNLGNPLPAELFKTGLDILKGIVSNLNTRDLLLFAQNRLTVTPNSKVIKIDYDDPDIGVKIASIANIIETKTKTQLRFMPFNLFDNFYEQEKVYTTRQINDKVWEIEIKQSSVNKELSIIYNEKLECEMNTEYYAPDEYEELFILALSSKLLTVFARLDGTMKESIDTELDRVVKNIQSKQYNAKLIMNNKYDNNSVFSTFLNGWY